MKKIKINKVIFLTLTIVLLTSAISFAEQPFKNPSKEKLNILQLVEKYSPEALEDWKQVLQERRDLKIKLLKSHKGIIDSEKPFRKNKEYIKDLRTKVENQEISKEEAKKRIKEYKAKCKEKNKYHKKKYNSELYTLKKDLYKAVSEKDEKQVKVILDKLYVKYQEANKRLKGKIK